MREISDLVALRDPEGILSLYVDAGAERENRHRPRACEVALRDGLERVRRALRLDGDRRRARLLDARLGELAGPLDALVDPTRPEPGRALIVPLSGGAPTEIVTARLMGDHAVLEATAHAAPLLGPLAHSDTAGVVSLGAEEVRVVEIRPEGAEEVLVAGYGIPSEDWRPMVGPAASNPALARHSASQRDLFERRLEEHRDRRIREIAASVSNEAARRGWDHLVLAPAGERAQAFAEALAPGAPALLVLEARLSRELTPVGVRAAVAAPVDEARQRAARALTGHLVDAALSASGRAVVGLDDTLSALSEGRAGRLVLDASARHRGVRSADGRLAAAGERLPGADPSELVTEPHLVERMIERALATGAAVTAVDGGAAEPLAPFGGVGAESRW